MRVFIASPLYSYTGGRGEVEGTGGTVAELLVELDRRFPGIRRRVVDEQDRIRPHMRIYIGAEPAASLDEPIPEGEEIHVLQALSGGQTLDVASSWSSLISMSNLALEEPAKPALVLLLQILLHPVLTRDLASTAPSPAVALRFIVLVICSGPFVRQVFARSDISHRDEDDLALDPDVGLAGVVRVEHASFPVILPHRRNEQVVGVCHQPRLEPIGSITE